MKPWSHRAAFLIWCLGGAMGWCVLLALVVALM